MSLSGKQLRYLFALGILKHSGGGGNGGRGKVVYNRERAQSVRKMSGKGSPGSTFRQKGSTFLAGKGSERAKDFALGNRSGNAGSPYKAGTWGAKLARKSGKPDYSGTRGERLAASRKQFRVGDNAEREAKRIVEGARNRGGDTTYGLPFDKAILSMKPRALSARVERLRRIGMNVAPENLGGTGREFAARIRKEEQRRQSIGKKRAGVRALQEKYGPDVAERIVRKYSGRTAQR